MNKNNRERNYVWVKILNRSLELASNTAASLSTIFTIGLMVLISANIFFRWLGHSLPGLVEGSALLMVMIVFLGLSRAERSNEHIAVDLLTRLLPDRIRASILLLSKFIAVVLLIWMSYGAFVAFYHSVAVNEYQYGLVRFPIWPARLVVVIGTVLFTLECGRNAMKLLALIFKPKA